ncbi:MAG: glutathione S-transferase N-terminal domain-containing protein [Halofilum sp. (in: g-proteobacteria)]|nr:glutathione S-transferase N-terminal domain-containing protein [Halofilum sp. (in: g-proteobacteria)]
MTVTHRSVMTLFSSPDSVYSHRARIVLAEKDIQAVIQQINGGQEAEDLYDLNPYGSLPTLVDRDLALYDSRVIVEYLDERFPHPPMMPVDPVSRAHARLALYRVETDWYTLLGDLETGEKSRRDKARTALRDSISAAADVFAARPFFLSEEFSMADAWIAPILWRLPHWGVKLPKQAAAVEAYAERIFAREGFRRSLSEDERALR